MTITIPESPAELEELLADSRRMNDVYKEGKLPDVVKAYATAFAKKDSGQISEQIKTEVQATLQEMLRDGEIKIPENQRQRINLNPEMDPAHPRNTLFNPTAPGARVDEAGLFKDRASFFKATWHGSKDPTSRGIQDRLESIRNEFGSSVPSDGGFLIPETLRSEMLRMALETALVRPRARVIPMDSLTVPFPTLDVTSHASTVFGGVQAYWTEESGSLTESSARFGRVKLEAKKLTGYTEVPNELFTDSIVSFMAFIDQIFPEAIAWFEDLAFIDGTGVGQPLGWLRSNAAVSVAAEAGQEADTILWNNIVKMYARMLPNSLGRAVWIANLNVFPQLATMALDVGTGGTAIWIGSGEGRGTPPVTILGRPVLFTEKVPTVGDLGDINFVDLGYYLIGDRQSMSSMSSPHYKFQNDQTAYRVIERVDGQPWIKSALTPKNGTDTLSPFVKLAAR